MDRCAAIVVAAGTGKRMGTDIPKQFLDLSGKPVLYYTLRALQESEIIQEIITVTSPELLKYVKTEIIEKYHFTKAGKTVAGGKERYDSVYEGLKVCPDAEYVLIQDGVRPFLDTAMIRRGYQTACLYGAAVAGMPSKDTVKLVDEKGIVTETPDRSRVWSVQTPQIFSYPLIRKAYDQLRDRDKTGITDDAMVLEKTGLGKIHMFEGAYTNIKITTPEDLQVAESFLKNTDKK